MRVRQKRLKSSDCSFVESSARFDEEAATGCGIVSRRRLDQNGSKSLLDLSSVDSGCFASRCAVKYIHEVVSKFDPVKKELVTSIGFGGILHFPPMRQVNRKVSMYLMKHVKQETCSLIIGDHIKITFNKHDIASLFGIPAQGKAVVSAGVGSRDAKQFVIENYLGQDFQEQRSVKIVQAIIEREYLNPMSKKEVDTFKVAFVVFVVSNLLCPSAKYDYASVDYWNAIQDADAISSYDWAGFVLARLLEGVSKLKQDIGNNIKFPNVTGCAIFLQVLYLDSLDLGSLSMPHDTLPRIRVFSFETIRKMIAADKNFVRHCKNDPGLPVSKLRDPAGCIYSWAINPSVCRDGSTSSCLLDIWETAVAMVHLLEIPFEAAGPVFVAVSNFQKQLNSGFIVSGNVAVKFLHVLVMIIFPYTRGFRYRPSNAAPASPDGDAIVSDAISNGIRLLSEPIRVLPWGHCNLESPAAQSEIVAAASPGVCSNACLEGGIVLDELSIGDDVQRSIDSALCTMTDAAEEMDVNERVASIMAQFYYIFRNRERRKHIDLNTCVDVASSSSASSTSSEVLVHENVPCPWDIGYVWPNCDNSSDDIFRMLNECHNDDRMAIVHRQPKYIQVSRCSLRSQLIGNCEMEVDLFDALVRVARQGDDSLYASYVDLRWRIFFESDFMGTVLSGLYDVSDIKIVEHLSLSGTSLDMKACKMVFFPCMLHHRWVCFVWRPDKNMIIVFDPSYTGVCPEWRQRLVERACYKLKLVLHTLSSVVFKGLVANVWSAQLRIINIADKCIDRLNRSGVLCSMFYRCFDGRMVTGFQGKADVDVIVRKLLFDLFKLKGNHGSLHHIPPPNV